MHAGIAFFKRGVGVPWGFPKGAPGTELSFEAQKGAYILPLN